MRRFIFLVFLSIFLWLPPIAKGQKTAEETAEQKMAKIRQETEEYASAKDFSAQDKIVNPEEYIVGPGDELTIFFYGGYTREARLTITPEGSALIPEFGEVYLGQISLKDAKEKILDALEKRYRNLEISVTLSKVRRLKVSVDGEVNLPGVYTVTSVDRVLEAIKLAGGITDNGSQRNIQVLRNGGIIKADLLSFARTGDNKSNPYLIEGDKIFLLPRQKMIGLIEIYGSVKLPGSYEYVPGDRVVNLVRLAGGLTIDADPGTAELVRFDEASDTTITMYIPLSSAMDDPESEFNLELLPDDRIFVRAIPDYHRKAQVSVEGEVQFPGIYAIKEDTTTLTDIIAQAGGFTALASLDEARMYRAGYEVMNEDELNRRIKISTDQLSEIERQYLLLRSDPDQGRVSINFRQLFASADSKLDITLKNGDRIIIPTKSNTVRIMGRVLKPGLITYMENADVGYYVERSGGFTKSADKGGIRIIKSNSGSIMKPSSKVQIEVGDEIMVPEKKETNWWQVTKDVGLFLANLATVYIVVDQIVK
jgi:protein involved in polysaccharide export with SLBB domain